MDVSQRARVAAAGKAETFAMRLALDDRASVEETRDDRGVDVGNIAFERGGAVHHRHAGDADIVFDGDRLALELAFRRALNIGLHVPGVERILLRTWPISRCARIFDDRYLVRHLIDDIVSGKAAVHQRNELANAFLAHGHAEALDDVAHLFECWALHCHDLSPAPCFRSPWLKSGLRRVLTRAWFLVDANEFVDEAMPVQFVRLGRMHNGPFLDDQDPLG